MTSVSAGKGREVLPDLFYYTNQIVNVIFIGRPDGKWAIVDAGMPASGEKLIKVAEDRYGKGARPEAIFLTHGHFDHVGGIVEMLEHWKDIPVYAHPLEFPYITGQQAYPEPDPTVQGGMLAKLSSIYPHEPVTIGPTLKPFFGQNLPGFEDWTWIHTPGHSPGHVSFFRQSDRTLIAGDAFVTVRQDSFFKVLLQKEEVNGPPRYLTTDWPAARLSVEKLASLNPQLAITGHGTHMAGPELREGLQHVVADFENMAVPEYGKYVD
ncbi:MAG: MBL fold metallo-hydrolase [Flavobacterium sp.]|nr:MAG: MBL fold metallo-hydrolase [Flavobacterium sp.]